jgi:hypothetical protein
MVKKKTKRIKRKNHTILKYKTSKRRSMKRRCTKKRSIRRYSKKRKLGRSRMKKMKGGVWPFGPSKEEQQEEQRQQQEEQRQQRWADFTAREIGLVETRLNTGENSAAHRFQNRLVEEERGDIGGMEYVREGKDSDWRVNKESLDMERRRQARRETRAAQERAQRTTLSRSQRVGIQGLQGV